MTIWAPDPITMLAECPECGRRVLELTAQRMRLDWPAEDRALNAQATWSLIQIGNIWVAGNGVGERGAGHALHRHQPPETA